VPLRPYYQVTAIQTFKQIRELLERLHGQEVAGIHVLGLKLLKSLSPLPDALVADTVTATDFSDRLLTIRANAYIIVLDLRRPGRLVWLVSPTAYTLA
jgi:hypothetical protein